MNRRPTGVVLAAVVLGLFSAMLLLMAVGSILMGIVMQHAPGLDTQTAGAPVPPPGLMLGIMAVLGVIYLAFAGWGIATVVGLFRMRSWSRISVMIIGGGLALIGLLAALGMLAAQSFARSAPLPPAADPAILRIVFVSAAVLWIAVAGVGIWWLVYFARRRTREAFAFAAGRTANLPPAAFQPAAFQPSALDFSVAQPMLPEQYPGAAMPQAPAMLVPPRTRPVSMVIVGVLMLIGAVFAFGEAFLTIPLFLLGFVLTGWTSHILMLVWAAAAGYAGYGLIKLQKPAWYTTLAIFSIGVFNSLLLVFPAYRAKMEAYTSSLSARMALKFPTPAGVPAPGLDPHMQAIFTMFGLAVGLALAVFLFILLWRARWAFEPGALQSPDPSPGI